MDKGKQKAGPLSDAALRAMRIAEAKTKPPVQVRHFPPRMHEVRLTLPLFHPGHSTYQPFHVSLETRATARVGQFFHSHFIPKHLAD